MSAAYPPADLLSPSTQPRNPSDPYYDLGTFGRNVSTSSQQSQIWFDRGLTFSYGFCHLEAVRCFEQSILFDPKNALAYWGFAYAQGPNYNKPWELFDAEDLEDSLRRCRLAVLTAIQLAQDPIVTGLAEALLYRFPEVDDGDYPRWTREYGDAMEKVYEQYGDDLDVAALYADSRMNLAPWELWDIKTGQPRAVAKTAQTRKVLERALTQPAAFRHPGVLHLYIHLMEMSPTPEIAVPIADHLRGLIPDGAHLNHMPSHLDLLIGDYRRAIASNLEAIVGDEKYARDSSSSDFYSFYRLHDYHILIYAALFNGQYNIAMQIADRLEENIPDSLLRVESPPLVDFLEGFKTVKVHVLVRFGKWKEILDYPFPDDRSFYCTTTAMLHYARGVAFSVLGDVPSAEKEKEAFALARSKVPETRLEYPNKTSDILKVGEAMLDGELEYRKGNYDLAFSHLNEAIKRSDNLIYAEPWGWMQPPRHAYAALKLERGYVEEALAVYSADLGFDDSLPRAHQHPNNVWALQGYHECLLKLGRTAEAGILGQQLRLALAISDVEVKSSCYCRTVDVEIQDEKVGRCGCD